MKKYITIRKSNDKVEAISNVLNEVNNDLFDQKEVIVNATDLDNIDNSFDTYYINNKFEYKEDSKTILNKEIDKVIESIDNAITIKELKIEILNLINLIK